MAINIFLPLILFLIDIFLLILILLILNTKMLNEYDKIEEENMHKDMRGF